MCKNHLSTGCLINQLKSANSRMIYFPAKGTEDFFEFFEEAFNEPECLLLLRTLLLENSSMQIFLHLSEAEHSNSKRHSISFIEEVDNQDYDIVKTINHEMKSMESLSPENNVWKILGSHFPRKIVDILDSQTLKEREIMDNLKSKVGSVFHAVIRSHQFWNIYNHAFYSRYEVSIFHSNPDKNIFVQNYLFMILGLH